MPEYRFAYRVFAEALYDALRGDAFYQALETSLPDRAAAREKMLAYLDYSMCEAKAGGELFLPAAHAHGVSVWARPLTPTAASAQKKAKLEFLENHLGANTRKTYCAIADSMAANAASIVDDSYWYLSIVGLLPAQQNRGLGAALISPVLEICDQLGVPSYLETFTPRNENFYARLGYRVAARFFEPTADASYALMTRAVPRGRSG